MTCPYRHQHVYTISRLTLTPSSLKPAVRTFVINPDSLIATPYDITNKENSKISIDDMDCIPHSPPISPAAPPKIQITLEEFNALHTQPIPQITMEQISDHPSPIYSPPTDTTSSVPSVMSCCPGCGYSRSGDELGSRECLRVPFSGHPQHKWGYKPDSTMGEAGSRAHDTHKLIFRALSPQGQLR
jgi:hypothetical protein